MTTIVYHNRTLVTDSRRVYNDGSSIYSEDIEESKGHVIVDSKLRPVAMLAIAGKQPLSSTMLRFNELFRYGIDVAKNFINTNKDEDFKTVIAGYLLDQAMIMYSDAAYEVVAVESDIDKIPSLVFRKINTLYVNGSGEKIAKSLVLSGYPLSQLMSKVSKFDSLTSPNTYVFMQDQLKEIVE